MADRNSGPWFVRIPIDALDPYIQLNASATDWRVLLAIARHQGYQNRKTFPLSVDKTAEEARCSRRAALRSISWWTELGALIKTKRRRMNVYEIPQHFIVSPGKDATQRHKTPRALRRDARGRIVPPHGTPNVPPYGTSEVPPHGTPNQRSSSEISIENPLRPHGGNGRPDESGRPRMTISEDTLRKLIAEKGREPILELLKQGGYPIPEFLLGDTQ